MFAHVGLMGERSGFPLDPLKMIFETIVLFAVSSGGPVGLVVNVPILEGFAFCLMMVGGEKRGVGGFVDEMIFCGVCQGVKELRSGGIVVETRMNSCAASEEVPLPAMQSVDVSGDEAVGALEKRDDVL